MRIKNTLRVNRWALIPAILICSAWSGFASAASPDPSCWTACFYQEPTLQYFSTHNVCFMTNNTWSATTQPGGWAGNWFQKGDRVRWYGNTGSLATAAFGQFSSPDVMTGEYAEWTVPGGANARHYNMVMYRSPGAKCQ